MTEIKGVLTTLNHALPAGVDPGRLAQWRLKGNRTYQEVRNDIVNEMTRLNMEIVESWGRFVYITELDMFEYPNGGAMDDVPDASDLDRAQPTKVDTKGHMIDLKKKHDGIGGTKEYFRDTRLSLIRAQLAYKRQRFIQTFEKQVLTRAFTNTENQLGASGYDMGWADGNTANVAYAPPAYGGKVFDTAHNHYLGVDDDSLSHGDLLNQLAETVAEHGHTGMLNALVSGADISSYYALGDRFIQPTGSAPLIIDRGSNTSGAAFFTPQEYGNRPDVGFYFVGQYLSNAGRMNVFATNRVPTTYAWVGNSYGMNDERNPIAIRIHPEVGFGIYISEVPSFDTTYPVKEIEINMEYGVSANEGRTNGAAGRLVSGGAWTNPTIS